MSLGGALIISLIVMIIVVLPLWPYSHGWGLTAGFVLTVILLLVVTIYLMGWLG